jgi:hypothetical protein
VEDHHPESPSQALPARGYGGGRHATVAHCQQRLNVYVPVEILQACRCYSAGGADAYGYAR